MMHPQDKLLFGSDCGCSDGHGGYQPEQQPCSRPTGRQVRRRETLSLLEQATSPDIFWKVVRGNVHSLLRIPG